MNDRTTHRYPAGRISDVKATTVTVPLEAPLRHANGAHWGRFVRTIVQVFTDEGLVGLGEIGGGGESAGAAPPGAKIHPRRPQPRQRTKARLGVPPPATPP